ncbi:MAG: hypothetical protein ACRBCI_10410 [Cellvibrionaceae bacterium]
MVAITRQQDQTALVLCGEAIFLVKGDGSLNELLATGDEIVVGGKKRKLLNIDGPTDNNCALSVNGQ